MRCEAQREQFVKTEPWCHLPVSLYWSLIQDSLFCSNYLIILHPVKEAGARDSSFIMAEDDDFRFLFFMIKFRI